jgi:ketosteroid isomerase-like protein
MSSDDQVELVRRFHAAWCSEDLDGVLECIHADIEFDWSESRAPFKGVYRGHDGMRRYWTDVRDAFDDFRPEIDDVIRCGDRCLVSATTVRGRAKASGIEIEARGAMLWTVDDGLIVSGKLFQTTDEALAAARNPA